MLCFERTDSSRKGAVIRAGGRKVRYKGRFPKRMSTVLSCPREKEPQPSTLRARQG